MDRFNALGRGMQIMLVGGVLLLIDTFFHWQSVSVGPVEVGQSAWHGFWGVVMGLLTLVLIAWLVVRLLAIEIALPISPTLIGAGLAVLIFICALFKKLSDSYSAWPAWVGLLLSIAILVGAWLQIQASGGMEALRSELPNMPSSTTSSTSTTSAPPPPAEPVAPPPPPPPPSGPPPGEEPPASSGPGPSSTAPSDE